LFARQRSSHRENNNTSASLFFILFLKEEEEEEKKENYLKYDISFQLIVALVESEHHVMSLDSPIDTMGRIREKVFFFIL